MKKAALCIAAITIILLVAIGLCAGEQLWKLYTDIIPYRVFQKLDEHYEHFIGQPIDDVLPLIAKDDQYLCSATTFLRNRDRKFEKKTAES